MPSRIACFFLASLLAATLTACGSSGGPTPDTNTITLFRWPSRQEHDAGISSFCVAWPELY